jgi:hypothetical protein
MALYAESNKLAGAQQNLAASPGKTLISLTALTGAATLKRGWIYEWEVGADGAPNATDCAITWEAIRNTSVGTATAATPSPLDSADTAAGLVCNVNFTAEPSLGVSLMAVALNQRNSQRWIARDEKSSLIIPATTITGIGMRAYSPTYASTGVATLFHAE